MKKSTNLKKDEELNLILRAKQGDVWARNEVIKNNLNLIRSIAQKNIQSSVLTKSDLICEGVFGLTVALEKFNPNLGFKFATYASWWIKQSMFKAISEQSCAYNIPVYVQETLSRYKKTKQEMEKMNNKEVSNKEIAKKLNISEEKINVFLNAYTKALSIESGIALTNNKELTLSEIIEDEKQNVEKEVIDNELKKDIKIALENLKEREKNVIVLRFGLEEKKKQTLEEIAKNYGVTKECIRQIEKRALNKIASLEFSKENLISYIR